MGKNLPMALGRSPVQQRFENPREILGDRLREGSIYRLLADHGLTLFGDDYFADLYSDSSATADHPGSDHGERDAVAGL